MTTPTTVAMLLPVLCTVWGIQQDAEHTYWATAAHCVPAVGQSVVIASPRGDGRRVQARVLSRDTLTDTATLMSWTKDVGTITTRPLIEPTPGLMAVQSHRGTIPGTMTNETLDIPGLSPRRLATARVIPGDSGASVVQENGVVGVVSHQVNGCLTGFCPTPPELAAKAAQQPLLQGDPLGICLRDIIAAIAGYFGMNWFNKRNDKPSA